MTKLINFILSKLPVFKQFNGYKTIIAAALIIIPSLLGLSADLLGLFPDAEFLNTLINVLGQVQVLLQKLAEIIGVPLLALGVGHKAIKDYE